MLTDTHAHLDFPALQGDFAGVLTRAGAADVKRIVTIGTSLEGSSSALALAREHASIFAAVGVHPNHVVEERPDFLPFLRELAGKPRVVAIGETGLDYFRLPKTGSEPAKAAQAAAFRTQLDLAAEMDLPVVIHERAAWDDTLAIIREYTGRIRAVFHCFGKGPAQAQEIVALGHLVSFTGIVTFKNAPDALASAVALPPGTFMVETDCPFLAPEPHRGKTCEPAHVRITAEFIARSRRIPLAELAEMTEATAEKFFRFSQPRR